MVSEDMWKYVYNSVFALFLPPDDIIQKVVYNDNGVNKDFKSVFELMAYIALNTDKAIVQKDVRFILKNNSLYDKCKNYYNSVENIIKERS